MIFMGAVRKVQARNIHPDAHQVANHFIGATGWANSAYNLCASRRDNGISRRLSSTHFCIACAAWIARFQVNSLVSLGSGSLDCFSGKFVQ
jgi:hypothetical protein